MAQPAAERQDGGDEPETTTAIKKVRGWKTQRKPVLVAHLAARGLAQTGPRVEMIKRLEEDDERIKRLEDDDRVQAVGTAAPANTIESHVLSQGYLPWSAAGVRIWCRGLKSQHFVQARVHRNKKGGVFGWALKSALLMNDVLAHVGDEIGVHGIIMVTAAGAVPERFIGPAGPQLFFAPYVWGTKSKAQWQAATLAYRSEICSAFGKHQGLPDQLPVLPIWAPNPSSQDHPVWVGYRTQPHQTAFLHPSAQDPPISAQVGETTGGYLDMLDGTWLFAPARTLYEIATYRIRKGTKTKLWRAIPFHKGKGFEKPHEDNIRTASKFLMSGKATGDPTIQLLQAISNMFYTSPDHLITHQQARSWANRAPEVGRPPAGLNGESDDSDGDSPEHTAVERGSRGARGKPGKSRGRGGRGRGGKAGAKDPEAQDANDDGGPGPSIRRGRGARASSAARGRGKGRGSARGTTDKDSGRGQLRGGKNKRSVNRSRGGTSRSTATAPKRGKRRSRESSEEAESGEDVESSQEAQSGEDEESGQEAPSESGGDESMASERPVSTRHSNRTRTRVSYTLKTAEEAEAEEEEE